MNKLFIYLIMVSFMTSLAFATVEVNPNTFDTSGGSISTLGVQILTKNSELAINSINKTSTGTPLYAYIFNNSDTLLANTSFVGNVADFGGYVLEANTYYKIAADSDGALYTRHFDNAATHPESNAFFNWTGGTSGTTVFTTVSYNIFSIDFDEFGAPPITTNLSSVYATPNFSISVDTTENTNMSYIIDTDSEVAICTICTSSTVDFSSISVGSHTLALKSENSNGINWNNNTFEIQPFQYFRFNDTNTGDMITNYTFGGVDSVGDTVAIDARDYSFGTQGLNFTKQGFITTQFDVVFNNTMQINDTLQVAPSTIVLKIFDRETSLLITENVSIELVATIGVNTNTITGQKNISNINFTNEEYILILTNANYESETLFFTFDNREILELNAYMLNSSAANIGSHTVKVETSDGDVIEAATVKLLEWDGSTSSYITVSQLKTDAGGLATFNIQLAQKLYKFLAIKDGFQQETQANLITVTGLQTLITISASVTDINILLNGVSGSLTNSSVNTTHERAFFTATDTSGLISEFCLNVYDIVGPSRTSLLVNCSSSSSVVLVSSPFNINKTSDTLIEATVDTGTISFVFDTITIKGTGKIGEILEDNGLLVLIPIILFIASLSIMLGVDLGLGLWGFIVSSIISTIFANRYMPEEVAAFIVVISLMMLWAGDKK